MTANQVHEGSVWFGVPSWWVPVWVSLDDGRANLDPLEEAVLAFIALGGLDAAGIARRLAVARSLVESATHSLLSRGVLESTENGLVAVEVDRDEVAVDREGWIAWGPSLRRPLLQVLLGSRLPERPPSPNGWALSEMTGREERPARPRTRDVDKALRLLPHAAATRVYERIGLGLSEVEGARIRSMRRKLDTASRANPIWIPTEHRLQGTAVWRPAIWPVADISTELDPGGWTSLIERIGEERAESAEAGRKAIRDEIMPGVIEATGFGSVAELASWSEEQARRELGPGWRRADGVIERAVADAFQHQTLGLVTNPTANSLAHGWVAVLEHLTKDLVEPARDRVGGHRGPVGLPRSDRKRRVVRVLGATWGHFRQAVSEEPTLESLTDQLRSHTDTIGSRLLALAMDCVIDGPGLARAEALEEALPGFFGHLGRALKERNSVIHPDRAQEPVSLAGFRVRVLKLCRASSGA